MSEIPILDGPRYGPAADGPPQQLILLLHGVGSDGKDLIELAPHLAQTLPNAAFIAPNAPNPYDQGLSGYQWISSGIRVEAEAVEAVKASAEILNAFIDEELRNIGLGPESLALIGFSQGTMMSLYTAPRRDHPIAGILGYSGRIVGANLMAAETKSRPPVFLAHGEMDPVLPIECLDAAQQTLEECSFSVQTLRCPNLGHSIDQNGIVEGTNFLRTIFGV
ncbi:MAG: phospholipase [Rickettsiales bacterium]|nr:phospholipase [Rickettsiales bacterium]|tara:strand:- start:713 stop:1375 length:663 start_codon:yes stop_codon:yes gene_type:complete